MIVRKWEWILWAILLTLTIISIILNRYVEAFKMVTVCFFALIMISFCINRVLYVMQIRIEYDEGLHQYFLELLNQGLITKSQYDNRDESLIRGYYKEYRYRRKQQMFIVIAIALIAVSIIVVYIRSV